MMPRTTLLLADDHLETAELLRNLLEEEFDVIAHVTNGRALVRDAERLRPDVIVTDISMPDLDGISAAAAILRQNPAARIILVTVHADPVLVARGLAAGEELVPAVYAALRCERHLSRSLHFALEPHRRC